MKTLIHLLLAVACVLIPAISAHAGARRFTYIYETTTAAPKSIEVENWVTWQTSKPSNSRFNEVDFRHELETGLTDRLQIGVYVADWFWQKDAVEHINTTRYQDSAVELIYSLSNPSTDWLGSAIYGELKVGDDALELEGKILLQKNVGRWVFAYNAVLEAVWEGRHWEETKGEFSQAAGVSYEVSPRLLVGAEIIHEIALPDWARAGAQPVWAGPNASYRQGNWWVTVTPVVQLTRVSDEPDFQLRAIFGVSF